MRTIRRGSSRLRCAKEALTALAAGLLLPAVSVWGQGSTAERPPAWQPQGLSGGGALFAPAISPVDPELMLVNCDMSAAYLSRDGGHTWRMIHHRQLGGNTRCRPAFHPQDRNVVFAASGWAGRLKVSRDGGETWSAIGNLPEGLCGAIAIDPVRPDLMLAGVGEEVWRSGNGGRDWTRCAGPRGPAVGFCFGQLAKSGPRVCFAGASDGVWRSDDGGHTWAEKGSGLPWRGLRSLAGGFSAGGGLGLLYCAIPSRRVDGQFAGGVFRSRDGGQTWESAMGSGTNQDVQAADQWAQGSIAEYHRVLTTDAKPLTVYAFNANTGVLPPHHTAVYRSDDGGETWRATFYPDPRFKGYNVAPDYTTIGDGQYYQDIPDGVAICATNPDIVMQVDSGCCHITTDGGRTWFNGHARPAQQAGFFECTGLVVTSTWHYYVDPFEARRRYICYTDIGFARSLDAGATWHWWGKDEKAPWRNTCYELAFDPDTPGKLWGAFSNVHDIPNDNIISGRHRATGPGGVCASTDFGQHWQTSSSGLPDAPCTSIVLDPRSQRGTRTLYAGVFGHGVFRSDDDGRSWMRKSAGLGSPQNLRVCRVQLHPDGTLFALLTALRERAGWVAEGVGLYRSRDRGETWELVNQTLPLLWPKDFAIDPQDSRVLYLAAADANRQEQGGLYGTRDGGASWTRLARKGPEHFGAYLSPHHPGWIYMTLCEGAPESGLWLSRDEGVHWQAFQELPFKNIQRVEFDPAAPDVIYVTTFGGSVWKGPAEPG
jgi:photosystem II stability/assembly factor-like uncharacterized protein